GAPHRASLGGSGCSATRSAKRTTPLGQNNRDERRTTERWADLAVRPPDPPKERCALRPEAPDTPGHRNFGQMWLPSDHFCPKNESRSPVNLQDDSGPASSGAWQVC